MPSPNRDARAFDLPTPPWPFPAAGIEMATRAMRRFSCTGAECPDSCCRDFGIAFDPPSVERMLVATAVDPVDHERIVRLRVLSAAPLDGSAVQASVSLDNDGACPLLESSGQCWMHRKYGESALATTCSVFPRTSLAIENRLEVTGTLACPELARLTLLTEDGPAQEPSVGSLLHRDYVGKTVDAGDESRDAYAAPFVRVRETLLHLFGRNDYPLGTRLVVAARLAAQVDRFFRRGTDAFEGSRRGLAFQLLQDELANAVNEAGLQAMHRDLQSFNGSSDAVVASAASLLIQRRRLRHPPRFAALLKAAFGSLQAEAGGGADRPLTPGELSVLVARRRERLEAKLPGLVDRILARYCRHYLLRYPYTDAPSLLNYLGRMALSVASIRLLLLGAPAVLSVLDAAAGAQVDEARLSAIAVDVIQIFTKAVSHQVDFLTAIQRVSEDSKGVTFGRLVLFAKFV